MAKNQTVYFPEPHKADILVSDIPVPGDDDLLIKTSRTLISTGTEMTAYSADYEPGSVWDKNFSCPFYPGYNNVGVVIDAGKNIDRSWIGKRVATTKPHAAYVTVTLGGEDGQASGGNGCTIVPDGVSDDDAVFFTAYGAYFRLDGDALEVGSSHDFSCLFKVFFDAVFRSVEHDR